MAILAGSSSREKALASPQGERLSAAVLGAAGTELLRWCLWFIISSKTQ